MSVQEKIMQDIRSRCDGHDGKIHPDEIEYIIIHHLAEAQPPYNTGKGEKINEFAETIGGFVEDTKKVVEELKKQNSAALLSAPNTGKLDQGFDIDLLLTFLREAGWLHNPYVSNSQMIKEFKNKTTTNDAQGTFKTTD